MGDEVTRLHAREEVRIRLAWRQSRAYGIYQESKSNGG